MAEWIVNVRRKLHKSPELMYDLTETATIVREVLDQLKIPYQYPIASHGIVATIGSGNQPVIALRSDMDALPINEVVKILIEKSDK
jgi:IAA-amino acid hydrolase